MKHYPTKNSLPERTRNEVSTELQKYLAASIDLNLQSKQAHWNVKGPDFIALHELFDKIAEDAEEYVDLLAERIVQLGGTAEGTIQSVSKHTELPAYSLAITSGRGHIEALATSMANYGELVRGMINRTDEMGDKDTSDIFTEISRAADKWLWMLEAHLQGEK